MSGAVPTSFEHDLHSDGILQANQSLLVPTSQPGTYYILVRGQSEPSPRTPVTVLVESLPFQVTDVSLDHGGDTFFVTTTIRGAQFHPESGLSEHGERMVRNFLDIAEGWNRERRDKGRAGVH